MRSTTSRSGSRLMPGARDHLLGLGRRVEVAPVGAVEQRPVSELVAEGVGARAVGDDAGEDAAQAVRKVLAVGDERRRDERGMGARRP